MANVEGFIFRSTRTLLRTTVGTPSNNPNWSITMANWFRLIVPVSSWSQCRNLEINSFHPPQRTRCSNLSLRTDSSPTSMLLESCSVVITACFWGPGNGFNLIYYKYRIFMKLYCVYWWTNGARKQSKQHIDNESIIPIVVSLQFSKARYLVRWHRIKWFSINGYSNWWSHSQLYSVSK